ncbi:hypothetical protein HanPI659440_Chr09g0349201 [Helianthus annuus]|nr:hypothetical protein HanPI659440_Chr09g0349201 [Helianthus annuus]
MTSLAANYPNFGRIPTVDNVSFHHIAYLIVLLFRTLFVVCTST